MNCNLIICSLPDIPVLLHHTGGTIDLSQGPGLCPGADQGIAVYLCQNSPLAQHMLLIYFKSQLL